MRREVTERGWGWLIYAGLVLALMLMSGCGLKTAVGGIPAGVESTINTVSDDIAQERYDKVYNESSELWKRDVTNEQSAEVLKTLHSKLGKVESRSVHSATEQQNSGGQLKGHAFIVTYQTKFERGEAMETFTLIEENGHWMLARYGELDGVEVSPRCSSPTVKEGSLTEVNHTREPSLTVGLLHRATTAEFLKDPRLSFYDHSLHIARNGRPLVGTKQIPEMARR